MINELFLKAGYRKIRDDQKTGLITYRKKNGNEFSGMILQSVNDALQLFDKLPEGTVLVVPTEDTPAPFISIYRNQRTKIAEKRFSVIVVNVEDLKISPFLGYPSDKDIVSQFNEPDLAVRIGAIWGKSEDEGQIS
jgi:hypothetical protein